MGCASSMAHSTTARLLPESSLHRLLGIHPAATVNIDTPAHRLRFRHTPSHNLLMGLAIRFTLYYFFERIKYLVYRRFYVSEPTSAKLNYSG